MLDIGIGLFIGALCACALYSFAWSRGWDSGYAEGKNIGTLFTACALPYEQILALREKWKKRDKVPHIPCPPPPPPPHYLTNEQIAVLRAEWERIWKHHEDHR